jgi:hypothetical protein
MTAGEKRKFYRNMGYERSARTIAVLGVQLAMFASPIALLVLAAAFIYGLSTGHNLLSGAHGVLAAAAVPVVGSQFLDVMNESEGRPTAERLSEDGVVIRDVAKRGGDRFEEALDQFIGLITNKPGFSRARRKYLLSEAETTSDFPILFGSVIDRQLLARYKSAADGAWRTYVKTGTQMDFRPADAIGVYGLEGGLNEVKEKAEYKADASLGDGKVSITLKKFGRFFPMSWETLINDDLGAFNDNADRMAKSALRTEYREATKLFAASTGPSTGLYGATIAHPIDGKAITNLFTSSALTIDNLGVGFTKLRHQVDSDGEPILIDGFVLVVPPALEIAALQILNKAALIAAGGDSGSGIKPTIRTSANIIANMNITLQVNPYLPIIDTSGNADTTWYLFATLANGAAVKLNFLQGHESPELCMKAPNKVMLGGGAANPLEGDFESDAVIWRIRHICGGKAIDPRMSAAFKA